MINEPRPSQEGDKDRCILTYCLYLLTDRPGLRSPACHPHSTKVATLSKRNQWAGFSLKLGKAGIQTGSVTNLLCILEQICQCSLELSCLMLSMAPRAPHYWATIRFSCFILSTPEPSFIKLLSTQFSLPPFASSRYPSLPLVYSRIYLPILLAWLVLHILQA